MSLLVSVVGSRSIAMAADSIHVSFRDGAVCVRTGYQKVLRAEKRLAGFVGVGSYGDWSLSAALFDALRTAPTLDLVIPELVHRNATVLEEATRAWREATGSEDAAVTIHLAERTPAGLRAAEWIWRTNPDTGFRGFEPSSPLTPGSDTAYVTVMGAFDSETARWSSAYRLEQLTATYLRTAALPVPHGLGPDLPRRRSREAARHIIEDALQRPPPPAGPWWPANIPTIAGPVVAESI